MAIFASLTRAVKITYTPPGGLRLWNSPNALRAHFVSAHGGYGPHNKPLEPSGMIASWPTDTASAGGSAPSR